MITLEDKYGIDLEEKVPLEMVYKILLEEYKELISKYNDLIYKNKVLENKLIDKEKGIELIKQDIISLENELDKDPNDRKHCYAKQLKECNKKYSLLSKEHLKLKKEKGIIKEINISKIKNKII